MQNNTKNVCRCCLNLAHSANFGFINEVMRKSFSLLLIKLDLDVSEHPLVCGTCSEVLDEVFTFKSKCLYTEDIISAHIETNSKVSLSDILMEIENKRNIHIGEDEVVCRLCMKIPLSDSYTALGETCDEISTVRDMIHIHLPEMDLSVSEEPIICEVCHVQLKSYASFATNCMAVEEKIKLYCDLQKVSGPVDLESVLQVMENKALDLQNRLNKDLIIKQEDDSLMVKVENVQDTGDYILEDNLVGSSSASELYLKYEKIEIKSEHDDMSEEVEDYVSTGAPSNLGKSGSLKRKRQIRKSRSKGRKRKSKLLMLKCENCEYETTHPSNLIRHNLRHKDESEVEMHKCENCEFETRYKRGMTLHMLTHRDPRAERKYRCDKCRYETHLRNSLRKHHLIHKEMHKCERCEYETRFKRSMAKHMVRHHDPIVEGKLKCNKCLYETDSESDLRRHTLIYKEDSEVEMHKCENCEFETRYMCNFIQHMRRENLNV